MRAPRLKKAARFGTRDGSDGGATAAGAPGAGRGGALAGKTTGAGTHSSLYILLATANAKRRGEEADSARPNRRRRTHGSQRNPQTAQSEA